MIPWQATSTSLSRPLPGSGRSREGDPATGKRKRIVRYVEGRKGEAEEVLAQLTTELAKGTYVEPAKTTLAEYLDHWLETTAKMTV